MAEVISLSTFHGHNLTDQDHALFMQTVTSQSGLFYGCEVTLKDENTLHVSTGEGIACGRIFRIMDMDYPVELSASGDLLGRLYVHIDTALDDTPAQLMDVQGSTLPALIQEDDMNQSTGVYEIELATFSINELGISNLEFTAPKATGGGAGGKSIAPDYVATESYEKGRIFFQNGTLYRTIAAIPAGAPLVVDTNVVETSLAAEIEALNQNLTCRYNAQTDRFEVLYNGSWVQSIKAFIQSIAVWVNGVFGIEVDNGTHSFSSSAPNRDAFTISGSSLVRASTVGDTVRTTLVSKEEIDFSNYSLVTVKTSSTNDITLNVSNFNSVGYLCVYTNRASSAQYGVYIYAFGVCISSAKDNFYDNVVNSLVTQQNANITGEQNVSISEITIE